MKTASLLDLTASQVARIEDAVGIPMDGWTKAPKGKLYPAILAELDGVDPSTFADTPMRDLVARLSLDEPEGKGPSEPRSPDSPGP